MKFLKRFDEGFARGETALAIVFLITMILLGSLQAILRNIADIGAGGATQWANDLLSHLPWIDEFLQKGTLWLAFLGASLATRDERHIAIDVLPRIASRKVKLLMKGLAGLGSAVVSFFLARAFFGAIRVAALERPQDYEVLTMEGAISICDATPEQMPPDAEMPGFFCAVRGALDAINVPVEQPWAILQLIVPVMFVVITLRLFANAIEAFLDIRKPDEPEVARPPSGEAHSSEAKEG